MEPNPKLWLCSDPKLSLMSDQSVRHTSNQFHWCGITLLICDVHIWHIWWFRIISWVSVWTDFSVSFILRWRVFLGNTVNLSNFDKNYISNRSGQDLNLKRNGEFVGLFRAVLHGHLHCSELGWIFSHFSVWNWHQGNVFFRDVCCAATLGIKCSLETGQIYLMVIMLLRFQAKKIIFSWSLSGSILGFSWYLYQCCRKPLEIPGAVWL